MAHELTAISKKANEKPSGDVHTMMRLKYPKHFHLSPNLTRAVARFPFGLQVTSSFCRILRKLLLLLPLKI